MIAGHRQLIERAHARGLKIYGATLTPFEGAAYYTAEGEAKRQALNEWIRTSGEYDGVIDFDKVTRDPAAPGKFLRRSTIRATTCTPATRATRRWATPSISRCSASVFAHGPEIETASVKAGRALRARTRRCV